MLCKVMAINIINDYLGLLSEPQTPISIQLTHLESSFNVFCATKTEFYFQTQFSYFLVSILYSQPSFAVTPSTSKSYCLHYHILKLITSIIGVIILVHLDKFGWLFIRTSKSSPHYWRKSTIKGIVSWTWGSRLCNPTIEGGWLLWVWGQSGLHSDF